VFQRQFLQHGKKCGTTRLFCAEKRNLLYHLIKNENLTDVPVFSRTKHGADNVVKALRKNNIAEAIHVTITECKTTRFDAALLVH
jgi:superfamily II DNA/RNA helicase